ncbi:response regulator [Ferruginibacter sp.]
MEQQHHILVIDDNEDILYMLQAMLKIKGYKVSVKKNIKALDEDIEKLAPDVILMDMLLSGIDGREVCVHLKAHQQFARIPVIMISAHPEAKETCLAAGADHFLEKPFEMSEMLRVVASALSQ